MKKKLFLYGASGHAKVVLEIAQLRDITVGGFIDANPEITSLQGYPVSLALPESVAQDYSYFISIGNNNIRREIACSAELKDVSFETLIHPFTAIPPSASIAEGTVVMAGGIINASAQIGRHCIINTNASVDHDCIIGDFVHLSPNVALAGNVHVGAGSHIGIGACVIQGVRIGEGCTIGAGAVIIRDVPAGATVVGNPGRIIKK